MMSVRWNLIHFISVARGAVAPLFILTRSVGTSSTYVGTLSLSVTDSICLELQNKKLLKASAKV